MKIIHAGVTSGPALAVCPHCKKVVGDFLVTLSYPFYGDPAAVRKPVNPEMLKIAFKPVEQCTCRGGM